MMLGSGSERSAMDWMITGDNGLGTIEGFSPCLELSPSLGPFSFSKRLLM